MRREERVTVQGPVKEQQPYGMSHGGAAGAVQGPNPPPSPPEGPYAIAWLCCRRSFVWCALRCSCALLLCVL